MAGTELGSAYISVGLGTNSLAGDIKKAFGGVDSAGGDAGKRAGGGFKAGFVGMIAGAVGALGIGTFLKGAVAEASGLGESINAVNVVFGKASKGVQQLGKESAKSLGLSNLEFNNLAVRFSSFADTIAGPGGDVTGTLKSMTGRASDFASVMNLDVAQAAELFQSGLAGETEPLRAFGIDMSAAAVEAFALKEGIASSAGSMSEAQKVQARYGLLMQQTSKTQGDFANTSGSLANQQRILSSSWKNTQAAIGTLFLPTLEKVAGFINASVMPNIDKLVASLGGGGLTGAFAPIMAVVGPVFDQLAASFGPLIPQVLQLAASFSPLGLLFQVITPILPMLATAFTQIAGSMAGVLAVVIPLVTQIVSALVPIIVQLVSTILPPLAAMFGTLIAAVAPFIVQIAGELIPIITALLPVVVTVFQVIASAITAAMQIIQGVIQVVTGIISGNWAQVWTGIGNIFSGIWNTIVAVVSGALQIIGSVVISALSGVMSFVGSALASVGQFFADTWNNVIGGVGGFVGNLLGYFAGLPGQILGTLGSLGGLLVNSGRSLIQGFIDGIRGMIGNIGSAIGGIMETARSFFPFSPAKRGPFSGRGYTTYSGEALAGDFAKSILGQQGRVASAAAAINGAAALSGSMVPVGATAGGAVAGNANGAASSSKVPVQNVIQLNGRTLFTVTTQLNAQYGSR